MKKTVFLSLLFLFIYGSGHTQTYWKLKILDGSSNAAVDFATFSINKSRYFPINSHGIFLIPKQLLSPGDSILISSIAYKSHSFIVTSVENLPLSINLEPAVYQLKEVAVLNPKLKTVELGNGTRFTINKFLPTFGQSFAYYISNESNKTGIIKNVKFKITNSLSGQKEPFKVKILSRPAMEINLPGGELIEDEIIVHNPTGKNWVDVDLLRYYLEMPKNGFFVVFEILPRSYYQSRTFNKHGRRFNQLPVIALSGEEKGNKNFSLLKNAGSQKWLEMSDMNLMIRAELIQD